MAGSIELTEAIAAARKGDRDRARDLLTFILQAEPGNELAWLWMSDVVESDEARSFCLQSALQITPNNAAAKAGLVRLAAKPPGECPPAEGGH